jgi:hypothetical protein
MKCITITCIYQVSNPNESVTALFTYEIRQKVEKSNELPRRIIRNPSVELSSDTATDISQYTAPQRTIKRIRWGKDIRLIFFNLLISSAANDPYHESSGNELFASQIYLEPNSIGILFFFLLCSRLEFYVH